MRHRAFAWWPAAVLCAALFAGSVRASDGRDRLTGIVLAQESARTILIHHDAFGGMPAMTMAFTIPAGTVMHPGDRIAADVDRTSDPWSLSSLAVTPAGPGPHADTVAFLERGDAVPATPFVDQTGRRITLTSLRGRPYVLTFMYTRCRDPRMCPFVSAKMHQLQTRTAGTNAALVEISLDPGYDRPPVLARYASIFEADPQRWHMLTGDPRTVLDFAARFRILERSAGPTTIIHSERLAIVDATGRITRLYDDASWRVDDVARALLPLDGGGRL